MTQTNRIATAWLPAGSARASNCALRHTGNSCAGHEADGSRSIAPTRDFPVARDKEMRRRAIVRRDDS